MRQELPNFKQPMVDYLNLSTCIKKGQKDPAVLELTQAYIDLLNTTNPLFAGWFSLAAEVERLEKEIALWKQRVLELEEKSEGVENASA